MPQDLTLIKPMHAPRELKGGGDGSEISALIHLTDMGTLFPLVAGTGAPGG